MSHSYGLPKIVLRPFPFTIARTIPLSKRLFLIITYFFRRDSPLPNFWLFNLFCFLEMGHLQYSIVKFYGNCNPINHHFPVNLFNENVFRLDNKTFIMLPYEVSHLMYAC